MKLHYCILLSLLTSTAAFAQADKGGNGGNVVVCPNQAPEMLDYVEASFRDMKITAPQGLNTVREWVEYYLKRLSVKDSRGVELPSETLPRLAYIRNYVKLAHQLLGDLEKFQGVPFTGNIVRFTDQNLRDLNDSLEVAIPDGNCVKRQLINQKKPTFPEDRLFTINAPLWKSMSPFQQAIAVIHELFYHEAIEYQQSDSRNARYLTATLLSDHFDQLNFCEWADRLYRANFRYERSSTQLTFMSHKRGNPSMVVWMGTEYRCDQDIVTMNGESFFLLHGRVIPFAGQIQFNARTGQFISATQVGYGDLYFAGKTPNTVYISDNASIEMMDANHARLKNMSFLKLKFKLENLFFPPLKQFVTQRKVTLILDLNQWTVEEEKTN